MIAALPYSPQTLSPEERAAQDANVVASARKRCVTAIEGCGLPNVAHAARLARSADDLVNVRAGLRSYRQANVDAGQPLAHVNVALRALGELWAVLP